MFRDKILVIDFDLMIIHLRHSPAAGESGKLFAKPMADSKNTVPRVRRQAGTGRQEVSA